MMAAPNFPVLVEGDSDPRFTFGLALQVAGVLVDHGYPRLNGADVVELQQALFRFLYRERD